MVDVERAYGIAMGIPEPFFRLCGDVRTGAVMLPSDFEAVRKQAMISDETRAFVIGDYARLLRGDVERYFDRAGFPQSHFDVDGVYSDGNVNVAVWLQRTDLERTYPARIQTAFARIGGIIVMERLVGWSETTLPVPPFLREVRRPPIARMAHHDTLRGPGPLGLDTLPPEVLCFYGEERAPEAYAAAYRQALMESLMAAERRL